jgi:ABC-type transporter Mla subunit MlaD
MATTTVWTKRQMALQLRWQLGDFMREEMAQALDELRNTRSQLIAAVNGLGAEAPKGLQWACGEVSRSIDQISEAIKTANDVYAQAASAECEAAIEATKNAQ